MFYWTNLIFFSSYINVMENLVAEQFIDVCVNEIVLLTDSTDIRQVSGSVSGNELSVRTELALNIITLT